jgi:hypothetical protein
MSFERGGLDAEAGTRCTGAATLAADDRLVASGADRA